MYFTYVLLSKRDNKFYNRFDAKGREKFLKGGSGHKYLNKQLAHFLHDFF